MAYHGILIPEQIAATNVDSFNRSAVSSASSIDNGFVFQLVGKNSGSVASGSGIEVFNVVAPATGSLSGLWMAYQGDEIVLTDSKYKGLDPDPRNFFHAQNKVFSAYKPMVGDIILVNAEAFTGTKNDYAVAVNGTYMLTWSATTVVGLSYKWLATKYISLATGGIDSQRITAYELECIIV